MGGVLNDGLACLLPGRGYGSLDLGYQWAATGAPPCESHSCVLPGLLALP